MTQDTPLVTLDAHGCIEILDPRLLRCVAGGADSAGPVGANAACTGPSTNDACLLKTDAYCPSATSSNESCLATLDGYCGTDFACPSVLSGCPDLLRPCVLAP